MLKDVFKAKELGRRIVTELWLYQDGSRILEISTKCAPSEAFQVAAETRVYLSDHGVTIGGQQAAKTRTALDFFSNQLSASTREAASGGNGVRPTSRRRKRAVRTAT